jgi:WD40 repeat protein
VVFDRQGSRIATVSQGQVRVFRFDNRPWIEMPEEGSIAGLAFSPDGERVATATSDISGKGGVRLFDARNGTELFQFMSHCCGDAVQFSRDGRYLGAIVSEGTATNELRIWEVGEHHMLGRRSAAREAMFGFALNSVLLAVQNNKDETVELSSWSLPTLGENKNLPRLRGKLRSLSADGQIVVTIDDGIVRVWDSQLGQELWTAKEDPDTYFRLGLSAKYVAIIKSNGVVEIRSIRNGYLEKVFDQDRFITCASFSPDNRFLATGSEAGTVRIWSISTGEQVAEMIHPAPVSIVAFSPDGRYVASADAGRNAVDADVGELSAVRVWLWAPAELVEFACHQLTRNLTQNEWRQYFPGEVYRNTCANLPVSASPQ